MFLPSKFKFTAGFFLGNCPCCDTEGPCTCPNLVSHTWRFTLSGISDGTGSNCSDYNGTHDITISDTTNCSGECLQVGTHSVYLLFTIVVGAITQVTLNFYGDTDTVCSDPDPSSGQIAQYLFSQLPGALCSKSSYTMSRTFFAGDCTGWPSSVTLTAV